MLYKKMLKTIGNPDSHLDFFEIFNKNLNKDKEHASEIKKNLYILFNQN